MSSISSILSGSSALGGSKRISGLASGLDTDELIKGMTIGTRTKIATQLQRKQTVQWTMDAVRSISSPLIDFADKYISMSSQTSLLKQSLFLKNKINATGTNSKNVDISGTSSSAADMAILAVKQLAKDATAKISNTSDKKMETGNVDLNAVTINNVAGNSITYKRGNTTYTMDLSESYTDSSGNSQPLQYDTLEHVKDSLNTLIANHAEGTEGLSQDQITFDISSDNKLIMKTAATLANDVELTDSTGSVLNLLGASSLKLEQGGSSSVEGTVVNNDNLATSNSTMAKALGGKNITFSYNGVQKTITFGTEAELTGLDGKDLAAHLQSKIDEAFGEKRVKVEFNSNGGSTTEGSFSFKTVKSNGTEVDNYSIFKAVGSDTGVLGEHGALKMLTGESNRLNTNASIKDAGFNFGGALKSVDLVEEVKMVDSDGKPIYEADGTTQKTKKEYYKGYVLDVNGKSVVIKETDTVKDAISKINKSDAGVKASYNETADTLTFTATDGGESGRTKIGDSSAGSGVVYTSKDGNTTVTLDPAAGSQTPSNLGSLISGMGGYEETKGQDAILVVDFDGEGGNDPVEISRSTNSFSVDGLTVNAKTTFDSFKKDSSGNYINSAGAVITGLTRDAHGNFFPASPINSDPKIGFDGTTGRYMHESGEMCDKNGNFVTRDGYRKDYTGANGEILTKNKKGEFVDTSNGNIYNGTVTTSYQDAIGQAVDSEGNLISNPAQKGTALSATDLKHSGTSDIPAIDYADQAIKMNPSVDADKVVEAVKTMIEDYNKIVDMVNEQVTTKHDRDYPPLTDEQKEEMSEDEIKNWETKAKEGMLYNDPDMQSLANDLRFVFSNYMSPDSTLGLKGIGISNDGGGGNDAYKNNGKLTLDEDKLRKALEERPEDVQKLFTDDLETTTDANGDEQTNFMSGGCMARMKYVTDKYAKTLGEPKGILVQKAGSVKAPLSILQNHMLTQMNEIDKTVTNLKRHLSSEETRYYSQFTRLEQLVSQMNSQSSWLSQQFGGTA